MSVTRREVMLILLGCLAIVAGLIVGIRNWRNWDIDILAAVAVIGGIAMIITALPTKPENDK